jgi:hypothetical protein
MLPKHVLLSLSGLFITALVTAQTTFIPQDQYSYQVLDRLEIKSGHLSTSFNSTIKPLARDAAAAFVLQLDSISKTGFDSAQFRHPYWQTIYFSRSDRYNMEKVLSDNAEWVPDNAGFIPSKHPFLNTFYKDKANLLTVNQPDFFLVVNPLIRLQAGTESGDNKMDFIATRGAELRGRIANKIGFYASFTENQERPPYFVQNRIQQWKAVPGIGYYKNLKNGEVDYLNAAGYITFGVTKYIDVQFGYDNNFIGDGYRSLFLSDYAPNYLFLKLNTHIWKLNYTNIFAELTSQFDKDKGDFLRPKKYMALHHLSMNVTPWLNLGIFENVIFSRANHFEFQYLNPIIFYRTIEQAVGSPDNANLGFNAKAIVAHHFEFYSQFFLDELKVKEFLGNRGWWGNKWALQLGGKYVDAFNVNNLDLQGEVNIIRPYTYTHNDSVANYSHYNEPLAHPQGANLVEFAGLVHYQPINKLHLEARLIASRQGLDDAVSDWGGNIFINYNEREQNYGNTIAQGLHNNLINFSFTASYELKHNLFVDLSYLKRKNTGSYSTYWHLEHENTGLFSVGLRWNMGRRDYDY